MTSKSEARKLVEAFEDAINDWTREQRFALGSLVKTLTADASSDRENELLEANNRYQQEARDARAALKGGYPDRVHSFMLACFGEAIAADGMERNHRFLEESLELVQALGCTASEAHQLVDYVFGRPIGEPHQEAGGVAVTFAALCNAHGINGAVAADNELTRCWSKIDKIRAKQAAKPKHGPLPETVPAAQAQQLGELADDAFTVLNWAKRLGFDRERQIKELIRTFEIRLGYRQAEEKVDG